MNRLVISVDICSPLFLFAARTCHPFVVVVFQFSFIMVSKLLLLDNRWIYDAWSFNSVLQLKIRNDFDPVLSPESSLFVLKSNKKVSFNSTHTHTYIVIRFCSTCLLKI